MSGPAAVPRVAVVVPARDEARDLGAALAAILAQDLPRAELEVIVVDGGSTDATAAIARAALAPAGLARWEVVANATGTTPSNLNAGLAAVTAPVLCRVDARSLVPPDYVRRCLEVLAARPEVSVVGGAQVARARDRSARAAGIARALNNSWGMGFARYRRGAPSGPSDTVYLGAFRTADLRAIGGWDERFTTNQDFDLNRRMATLGTIWYEGDLPVAYLPRTEVSAVLRQYHRFGRWKVRYWRWRGDRPTPRQSVILVGALVAGVGGLGWARARPTRWLALAGVTAGAAVAVEEAGRPREMPGPRGPVVRAVSVTTLASVWAGWLSGVLREALTGRSRTAG